MKTILEVSPTTRTFYTMDDYTYTIVIGIFENYYHLYHKPATMEKALTYLPEELANDITIKATPAYQPLIGQHVSLWIYRN